MMTIQEGCMVPLRCGGKMVKIVEVLPYPNHPKWEQTVDGRGVFVGREFTTENVERWSSNLIIEVEGRQEYARWFDVVIDSRLVPAPEKVAAVKAAPGTSRKVILPSPRAAVKPVEAAPVPVVVAKAKPSLSLPLRASPKLVLKKPN